MSENFSQEFISDIINVNRFLVAGRRESFDVSLERLHKVFDFVNEPIHISDDRVRIIVRAARILGGITFEQPFNNANKTTATTVTVDFLRSNGYDLPIINESDEEEHIELLEKTLYKFEGDHTIISEVEEYLLRKVVPLTKK